MSSISRFVEKSRVELKARPILPFGAPVKLGAIGVVDDDQFSPRGNVRSILGADIGEVTTGQRANWQAESGNDVKVSFLGDGETSSLFPSAPKAGAKVEISFGSSDSFFVSVNGLQISTMTDPAGLLELMLDARKRGTWQDHYILVYEVITPTHALALLSKASNSKFLLSANADVKAPQGAANLAGNFQLSYQNKDAVNLDSGGQPLFFNAFRLDEDFWTGDSRIRTLNVDLLRQDYRA